MIAGAPGQVLVINQNGIIFGGASQINVGSLIASSANITDGQFGNGIYASQSGNVYVPNFTGAGRTQSDDKGYYKFITIKPGAYPWGNHHNAWRPAHVHFSLLGRAFTQRLVTQMYFPGDPLFPYDPIYNSIRDEKARERLIADFSIHDTTPNFALAYNFDIYLPLWLARHNKRVFGALYVGGMGSREQNFYNQLATRMGFGQAAAEVQDLYLAGRHRDAADAGGELERHGPPSLTGRRRGRRAGRRCGR